MRVEPPAAGLGIKPPGPAPDLHQPDDEGNRHAKVGRRRMTRVPGIDKPGNPFPKITLLASQMTSGRK